MADDATSVALAPVPSGVGPAGIGGAGVVAAVALAVVGALPFFTATTFTGDDHLFLAFARYAPHPLTAFVRDQHGGEFYRPLPMCLWWLLSRMAPGSSTPFAAAAFALHAAVAIELAAFVASGGHGRRGAWLAGALFFLAPMTREAAYWFSASTDLLATAFGLGSLLALRRGQALVAAALFAAACWSKEWALVLPALALVTDVSGKPRRGSGWLSALTRTAPLLAVAALYLMARTFVLHGFGGSGDEAAPFAGKLLQVGAGLVHVVAGWETVSEPVAWVLGTATWIALGAGAIARRRTSARLGAGSPPAVPAGPVLPAVAWIGLGVLPLLAAPWIIGARYFYLAAVGVAWLAAELLRRRSLPVLIGVLATLAGLDLAQATTRARDVASYEARLGAARRAVAAGLARGDTTFHLASGIKDIDLAVKEDPRMAPHESTLVVLGDVPASFVAVPEARAGELDFLLARPPLPPSGAYRFGGRRIAGLARRGDDPGLEEVVARLPGIRFIRLRTAPFGRVIYRDVTETLLRDGDAGSDEAPSPN